MIDLAAAIHQAIMFVVVGVGLAAVAGIGVSILVEVGRARQAARRGRRW